MRHPALVMGTALAVLIIGERIPLPGIDLDMLGGGAGTAFRMSILALGVMPILVVLVHVEIARLLLPSFARWQAASRENAHRVTMAVRVIALLLAATQGYGVVVGLEAADVIDPEAVYFVPVATMCLVAGTAFLIWLIERVSLTGLVNGLWLLLAFEFLAGIPNEAFSTFMMARMGAVSSEMLVFAAGFIVASTASIVFVHDALRKAERPKVSLPPAVLLWPPFLASTVAGYIAGPMLLVSPYAMGDSLISLIVVGAAIQALLIPLFVYGYARLSRRDEAPPSGRAAILTLVAAVQMIICTAGEVLPFLFDVPLHFNGALLIVFVAVLLTLRPKQDVRPGTRIDDL